MQYDAATASGGADDASAVPGLDELDRHIRGSFSQLTGGQSLWAALQAWEDWQIHLAASPGRQLQLGLQWGGELADIYRMSFWPGVAPALRPDPHDRRFRTHGWRNWPYSLLAQGQLALDDRARVAEAHALHLLVLSNGESDHARLLVDRLHSTVHTRERDTNRMR